MTGTEPQAPTKARADSSRRWMRWLGVAGLGVYLVTAISNIGIVAIDDYFQVMSRVVPAGAYTPEQIVAGTGVYNPLPVLLHLGVVRLGSMLGILHPYNQLRFDQAFLAFISFVTMWYAGTSCFAPGTGLERARHQLIFTGLIGFYFAAPLFLTRPMVEALVAPFLLLGTALACRYWTSHARWALVLATFVFAAGAMLRPQAGIVALTLPMAVVYRRRWADLVVLLLAGAAAFVITGLLDGAVRGGFHESLRRYVTFNLQHSSDFGVSPWYTYLLLLVGATLPPAFLAGYRGFPWRQRYEPLIPAVAAFGIFVATHSLVPHKEERFMIPIMPLLLLLLTPLAAWLLEHGPQWRVVYFAGLNLVLLSLMVLNPPQKTGMSLARYLDAKTDIHYLILVDKAMFVPSVFITHPVAVAFEVPTTPPPCGTAVAVLALGAHGRQLAQTAGFVRAARFAPGPLERLVVAINPRHNERRGPVDVYVGSCDTAGTQRPRE